MASRYIRAAVEEGRVKPVDARAGRRRMRYVPFWAAGRNSDVYLTAARERWRVFLQRIESSKDFNLTVI